jgi:DNA-binding GntR family transcriptional regulator
VREREQANPGSADEKGIEGLHARLMAGLRGLIVRGDLPAGERVPEAALCARFAVSRTPLREALKALSAEGLVTLRPNRGAVVTPLDAAHLADLFEAKGVLEHFIGLNATTRATDAELASLRSLHDLLAEAEAAEDHVRYTDLNEAFHLQLARLAGNSEILRIYERMQANILMARHRINDDPARVQASLAEHESIIQAIGIRARLDTADRLVAHNAATARAVIDRVEEAARLR